MAKTSEKTSRRTARHARIRANVQGTAERPRLAIFKSNRATYAQLINDEAGNTIAAADTRASKAKTATERAAEVGTQIAELAKKANITEVVFDRGGFKYQGGIAALADNARAGGLKF